MGKLKKYAEREPLPLFANTREQYVAFFFVSVGVTALTYLFLFAIDFLPEEPGTSEPALAATDIPVEDETLPPIMPEIGLSASSDSDVVDMVAPVVSQGSTSDIRNTSPSVSLGSAERYPIRIIFDSFDREVTVLNPEVRTVEGLDAALLKGVVRHPDSADFERTGTIILFGHSSYLPNVINKNFQAFNGIQKLVWGDVVRLRSTEREYVYRVDRVYETPATGAEVKVETGTPKLTLVTCDSFGSKDDRFVVEATLVEEKAL